MGFKKPDSVNPLRIVKPTFNRKGKKKDLGNVPNATEDWSYYHKKPKKM
jgi:hypothetical protein